VGLGDDVVTVSHSFIATANAIVAVGARPIFVDIDPATYGMDARLLEAALTAKTRAILCVHQLGFPCALPAILDIAQKHRLPVIEDAACAIGSAIEILDMETLGGFALHSAPATRPASPSLRSASPSLPATVRAERSSAAPHATGAWQAIGQPHGLAACFSFHPRKVITTGDGGMITTADEALAARLRQLRQHAMSATSTIRHESQRVLFESFLEPAYNFRMTDMQAALARPQLARLKQTIATRRALAERYRTALADHTALAPPQELPWMRANFQSYPLRLRPTARQSQVEIMQYLLDRGIASRRGVSNAHAEPAYATTPWSCGPEPCDARLHREGRCLRLRHSEEARDGTIMIPLFHGMTEAEQDHVLAALGALSA
jgi:dTDP-4-amino-4,6-dideoxygalactose transaminase